ncbi:MAG: amidase family protein, partial [Pseudomonadales bacterium]
GIIAFASSLDQAGPMTKTVRDSAIFLNAISGHDNKDSTSAPFTVPNFETAITGDIKGKKIGIPKEYRLDGMPDEIEKLCPSHLRAYRDHQRDGISNSTDCTRKSTPSAIDDDSALVFWKS